MDKEQIKNVINRAKGEAGKADVAIRYFNGEHDILDNKITVITEQGQEKESPHSSNIKIPIAFFTELVTQSTDFIFSEDIQFNTEDEILEIALESYINSDTHLLLYEAVEEASKKGKEWIYAYRDNNGLINFMRVDSRQVAEVVNEYGEQEAVVRYRKDEATIWYKDGRKETYKKNEKNDEYELISEANHTIYDEATGEVVSGLGRIPFFKLKNNRLETSDLDLIKPLIDDYDRMQSYASNDLQDFRSNIAIFSGTGNNDNLGASIHNMYSTGVVTSKKNNNVDIKSNDVNIEQRQNKMRKNKEDIYKLGQGFDDSSISNSNGTVTNVVLKAGQQSLHNKAKGKIKYLNTLLNWMLELILEDIEQKGLGSYSVNSIEIEYTLGIIESDVEKAEIDKIEAETDKIKVDMLLSVEHLLDEDTALEEVGKILNINVGEVKNRLKLEGYGESLLEATAGVDE